MNVGDVGRGQECGERALSVSVDAGIQSVGDPGRAERGRVS
jgi:hypothetical protein